MTPGAEPTLVQRENRLVEQEAYQVDDFTSPAVTISLRLLDAYGEARKSLPYKLTIGSETIEGKTSDDGKLSERVPRGASEATLEVEGERVKLEIAPIEPVDNTKGMQHRLSNLGYDPGPIDGKLGHRTVDAIRAFQRDNPPLKIDGVCGPDTQSKLIERHGG